MFLSASNKYGLNASMYVTNCSPTTRNTGNENVVKTQTPEHTFNFKAQTSVCFKKL